MCPGRGCVSKHCLTFVLSSLALLPSGYLVTSPRFELPMGTTEQPPLPQQTQPPSKVPCPNPAECLGAHPPQCVVCHRPGEEGSSQLPQKAWGAGQLPVPRERGIAKADFSHGQPHPCHPVSLGPQTAGPTAGVINGGKKCTTGTVNSEGAMAAHRAYLRSRRGLCLWPEPSLCK